jgi:hypothetical protein
MSIIASKGNSANVTFTNPQEIVISQADDSIRIGDGVNLAEVESTTLALKAAPPMFITRVDEASSTITYVGEANPGTATSGAFWRIYKLDETSGLIKTYADGNFNFDNVWDNRASLSYS